MCLFLEKIINETKMRKKVSEILVQKAQEFGSGDNITAIFVMLKKFIEF